MRRGAAQDGSGPEEEFFKGGDLYSSDEEDYSDNEEEYGQDQYSDEDGGLLSSGIEDDDFGSNP